jgi:arylsulfatase A-like enzyme
MTFAIFLFLLLSLSSAFAKRAPGDDRPNFILFYPDTLRAESHGAYGNTIPNVTPNFDKFASTGTLFKQAHVAHTQCSPSRATMMTGRYMHVLGHRTQIHLIRAYEENYFRLLKDAGYHVKWLGKNDALSKAAFNMSVSSWENDIGYDSGHNMFNFGEAGYWSMLSSGGKKHANDTSQGDFKAVTKAIDFMNNDPPEPFLLFLPTRGAHPPYGSPLEYQHKWTLEEVKKHVKLRPPNNPKKPKYHSPTIGIQHYRNLTSLTNDTFYKIQQIYLEMISFTDWTFGQLLNGLQKSGLESNTAVFYSSDHGDFAGDYHLVEKWPGGADDVLTRVPMAIKIPNGLSKNIVHGPVQSMDMLETMIDLAGIQTDWVRFGVSLKNVMNHNDENDTNDNLNRYVYSEGGFFYHSELFPGGSDHVPNNPKGMYWPRAQEEMSNNGTGSPKWVMVRNMTHKLVYRPNGMCELYDLMIDDRELNNVYEKDRYQSLRNELEKHMIEWLIKTGDVPPLRNDPRGPPKNPNPINEETCETLLQPDPSKDSEVLIETNDLMGINGIPHFST